MCLKSDWTRIGLLPPDYFCFTTDISKLSVGQYILYVFSSIMEFTMPKDLYVEYHYCLDIYYHYHLLPFGSSEMHVFLSVCNFYSNILLCEFSYTFLFMPSFPSNLQSFSFLVPNIHSHSCIHFHCCIYFQFCIHFHTFIFILNSFHSFSFMNSFHSLSFTSLACIIFS